MARASRTEEFESTANMTERALECRETGRHRFPYFSRYASQARTALRGNRISLEVTDKCENECGVERTVEWNLMTFELIRRTLKYPRDENGDDTYLLPKQFRSAGRLASTELRQAIVARLPNGNGRRK